MAVTFVPFREMKTSKGQVISDKDLEILLDRSDLMGEERHHSAVFRGLQNTLLQGNTGPTTFLLHYTISINE